LPEVKACRRKHAAIRLNCARRNDASQQLKGPLDAAQEDFEAM
jgi:hypothetical protein